MRRWLLLGIAIAALVAPRAIAQPTWPRLPGPDEGCPIPVAAWGAVIAEARTGAIRFETHSEAPMAPASVMKLLTSAVALRRLGPEFRFLTRLYAAGDRKGDRLDGDLVLVGGGDPTLTTADLRDLARTVRQQGLTSVTGRMVVDDTWIATPSWEPGWVVDDLSTAYGSGVTGLMLDDASGSLADPGLATAATLKTALGQAGVTLDGPVCRANLPPGSPLLADHASAPLGSVLARMNKASLNHYAEALFRVLGPDHAAQGSAAALGTELAAWGVATGDLRIADGSGLSRYDLVTPRAIARVLVAMAATPEAAVYRTSLPLAGVDGTLAHRFQSSPLKGRLWAKTGTMSGVSALAGYLETPHGHSWAIVVVANGFTGSVRPIQHQQDAWLERVGAHLAAEM